MLPADGSWGPKALRIVLWSPPGGGKETQAAYLRRRYGFTVISPRSLVSDGLRRGSEHAAAALESRRQGDAVRSEQWEPLLEAELTSERARRGVVITGLPRHLGEAELIEAMLEPYGGLDIVVQLNLSDEQVAQRLRGRLVHPRSGRVYHTAVKQPKTKDRDDITHEPLVTDPQDAPDQIRQRLQRYHRLSEPVLSHFRSRGVLVEVDAAGLPQDISARIREKVDAVLQDKSRISVTPTLIQPPFGDDVSATWFSREQLEELFQALDVDRSGVLDREEFAKCYCELEWYGREPTRKDIDDLVGKYGGSDHKLSFEEFCILMLRHAKS